ncbi:flavodoxin reductase [Marivirga sp. S37H4]|uniref:Flavodoxin reductase n=1 Tax=Marivirga aurantiaca TaxID=2802615 RepID=A0A934WZS2_9BACT|nr:flavodoxin reductase [Marivirga aurantiaca]MBK6265760.1 flavodoxin reductase [Marivirga aurantiaca]
MANTVKITNIRSLTHNVTEITTQKPKEYAFEPGQSTEVAINKEGWKEEKRPFSFTSLPEDDFLQFSIKSYRDHNGVTDKVNGLIAGDELKIGDPVGTIQYKGNGTFIAGGAGITPFISIFKDLEKKNKLNGNSLIFSNKTSKDVILESYWQDIFDDNFISTLTQENVEGHENDKIGMEFLKKHIEDFSQNFYLCGPEEMVKDISELLKILGARADAIVFEKY